MSFLALQTELNVALPELPPGSKNPFLHSEYTRTHYSIFGLNTCQHKKTCWKLEFTADSLFFGGLECIHFSVGGGGGCKKDRMNKANVP